MVKPALTHRLVLFPAIIAAAVLSVSVVWLFWPTAVDVVELPVPDATPGFEAQESFALKQFVEQLGEISRTGTVGPEFRKGLAGFARWYEGLEADWQKPMQDQELCSLAITDLLRSLFEAEDVRPGGSKAKVTSTVEGIATPGVALESPRLASCRQTLADIASLERSLLETVFTVQADGSVGFTMLAEEISGPGANLLQAWLFHLSPQQQGPLREGAAYAWNAQNLQRALEYAAEYESLATRYPEMISTDASETASVLAPLLRNSLRDAMMSEIANAQVEFEAPSSAIADANLERSVAERIRSFSSAASALPLIDSRFRQLGMLGAQEQVSRSVVSYAMSLLIDVERLKDEAAFYSVAELPSYKTPSIQSGVFRQSPAQVSEWLHSESRRAEQLIYNYASPLVAFLVNADSGQESSSLYRSWLATVRDASATSQGLPSSSLSALHSYIADTLADVSWENCAQLETPENPGPGLYDQALLQIAAEIDRLCLGYHTVSMDSYQQLADTFNRTLSGRYPFVDDVRQNRIDAIPGNIRRFIEQFIELQPGLLVRMNDGGDAYADVVDFIEQMSDVSVLFGAGQGESGLPQGLAVKLGIDIQPDFQSQGSASITQWTVRSGSTEVTLPGSSNELIWHYGEPFQIVLTYAANAPRIPIPGGPDNNASAVEGNSVHYLDSSPWALFRVIERHRSVAPAAGASSAALVLKLQTAVRPMDEAEPGTAILDPVYLYFHVYPHTRAGDDPGPVSWPEHFPERAPPLPLH